MEPYQTSISNSALNKIQQMMAQKKAAGKKVEPWELEAAYKAAMDTEAARTSENYYQNRILSLKEKELMANQKYKKDLLKAEGDASTLSGIGSLASTALLAKALKIW